MVRDFVEDDWIEVVVGDLIMRFFTPDRKIKIVLSRTCFYLQEVDAAVV